MVDVDAISAILRECAQLYILPRYKVLEAHEISSKTSPRDLVTQADIDVENHLKSVLPGLLPGSIVAGEEGVSNGEVSLDVLKDESRPVWVVDPVDGTYNFVHSKREFGVMLACVINGETRHAWIYDVLGESMIIAGTDEGAFANGERLRVASLDDAAAMTGHINPGYFPKEYKDHIKDARAKFKSCESLNCAAHEYLRVASGEAQFSIYSRLKPWDHLAGSLIVQEAGGHVARWDGKPYRPADHHVGLLAAASRENWQSVFDIFLKDHFKKSN